MSFANDCDCGSNIFNNDPDVDDEYDVANIGTGTGIYAGSSIVPPTTTFEFKSLKAGTNVSLSSDADSITISSTDTGVTVLSNNGGGAAVGQNITGNTLNLRTITTTGAVTVTQNANTVNFNSNAPTSVSNVGIGTAQVGNGIVAGNVLQLKTISASNGVAVSQSADTIFLTNNMVVSNNGGGEGLLMNNIGGILNAKTLIPGTNMSLSSTANTVTLNNTLVPTNTVTNLGAGAQVLVDVLAGSVRGRTLVGVAGTAINQSGNVINISSNTSGSLGVGAPVYAGVSGTVDTFRSLVNGGNIGISFDAGNIYLSAPDPIIVVPYSGNTNVTTYPSGNPEILSLMGFGSATNTQTSQDVFDPIPNDLTDLGFTGYCATKTYRINKLKAYIQAITGYTQTPGEELQVYAFIMHSKTPDRALQLDWFDKIVVITGGYSINDNWFQRFEPGVTVEENWTVFVGIFVQRTGVTGDTSAIQFNACMSTEGA